MAITSLLLASLVLPHLVVIDDHDVRRDLREVATGAILLPIFTRCGGTCPMTAVALARANPSSRVVLFSFDDEDTSRDLREFRERFALPASWIAVRSPDPGATRAFLDSLDFHVMKSEGGFDHPNLLFVISPDGTSAAAIAGTSFTASDLERVRPVNWSVWIALACAGLTLCAAALVFVKWPRYRLRA